MAISGTQLLNTGVASPTTSEDTASVSPTSNALLLLDVVGSNGGGIAPDAPSSITGNGLTWVQIATAAPLTDGASETWRVTRYRAMGASPSTGAITISHTTAPDQYLSWCLREYTGVVTTGSNGADAEVQTATNIGDSTTASVTLSAFGDAGNGADAFTVTFGTPTITPESGWTGLTADTTGHNKRAQWRDDNDTSPSATLSVTQDWAMLATEIAAAGADPIITADSGSVATTGTDAGLQHSRVVGADPGAVAVTGTDATLSVSAGNAVMTADPGSVAVAGTDASFALVRLGDAGAVSVTGTDAGLAHNRVMAANPGAVAVSGTDAAVLRGWFLVLDTGSVSVSGTDATLSATGTFVLVADSGSVAVSGTDASFLLGIVLQAEPGSVVATGSSTRFGDALLKTSPIPNSVKRYMINRK